jgi:hypothetical protein
MEARETLEALEIKGRPGGMHEAIGKPKNTPQDSGTLRPSFEDRFQKALSMDPSRFSVASG